MDDKLTIPLAVLALVPESVARGHSVLPFALIGDVVWCYYPADLARWAELEDELRFVMERPVQLVPLERSELCEAIDACYLESYPPAPTFHGGPPASHETPPNQIVPPIENCEPWFRYECPKKWQALTLTGDDNLRHCPECDQKVYRYSSRTEVQGLRGKRCVFIDDGVGEYLGEIDF